MRLAQLRQADLKLLKSPSAVWIFFHGRVASRN